MRSSLLTVTVFVCGASTMALELTGSRIVAPYVGTSIFVWTNLIGVFLGFLSLGYAWGGVLADRRPDPRALSIIILGAAIWVSLVALLHDPALAVIESGVRDVRAAAFIAAVVLFAAPSVLLGMVVPFAVRLATRSLDAAASTAGSLYAWSTLGSIAGTFAAGYVLLSYLGSTSVLLVIAVILAATSLAASVSARKAKILLIATLAVLTASSDLLAQAVHGKSLVDANTPYNRVWIYDLPGSFPPARIMQINDEFSSMQPLEGDELLVPYTRYYRLVAHFYPGIQKALMLGGAAYSYPRDFLKRVPEGRIDVVEIDPGVTELARKYFGLTDDPRLVIHHEDARTFLNRNREKYQAVLGDVFRSSSVPPHLTTEEAVGRIHAALDDEGVFIGNVIASIEGEGGAFLRAEVATLRKFFRQVHIFLVQDREDAKRVQNVILVALKSGRAPKFHSADPELHAYLQNLWIGPVDDSGPTLTDDFAPVERLSFSALSQLGKLPNPVLLHWRKILGLDRERQSS